MTSPGRTSWTPCQLVLLISGWVIWGWGGWPGMHVAVDTGRLWAIQPPMGRSDSGVMLPTGAPQAMQRARQIASQIDAKAWEESALSIEEWGRQLPEGVFPPIATIPLRKDDPATASTSQGFQEDQFQRWLGARTWSEEARQRRRWLQEDLDPDANLPWRATWSARPLPPGSSLASIVRLAEQAAWDAETADRSNLPPDNAVEAVPGWLEVGDRLLQLGAVERARGCYRRIDPTLEAPLGPVDSPRGSIPWYWVAKDLSDPTQVPEAIRTYIVGLTQSPQVAFAKATAWSRMVDCSILSMQWRRAEVELKWLQQLFPDALDRWPLDPQDLDRPMGEGLQRRLKIAMERSKLEEPSMALGDRQPLPSIAGDFAQGPPLADQEWRRWLPVVASGAMPRRMDRNRLQPRVAESSDGLLGYFPVLHRDRLYCNLGHRIIAQSIDPDGRWVSGNGVLFDTQVAEEEYVPAAESVVGVPRSSLTLIDDCLYARVGSAVTAWRERTSQTNRSMSLLVGLDLRKEGALLPGFPIALPETEWGKAEFEGSPIVVGDAICVVVTERTASQWQRRVAAFDRIDGRTLWVSPILAGSNPAGFESAHGVTQVRLSCLEERLVVDTGLGVIAALEADQGEVVWLATYPRPPGRETDTRSQAPFRQRDPPPPLLVADQVVVAPCDTPDLMSFDWETGQLRWISEPGVCRHVVHLLGATERHWVVSGDRVLWLDRYSGRLEGLYPDVLEAQLGGRGRGLLAGEQVVFPMSGSLQVLAAPNPPDNQIAVVGQVDLGVRGMQGANLFRSSNWLVLATPSRWLLCRSGPSTLVKREPTDTIPLQPDR
ncbi:MAG: PQQ-binding-like beta-propeller repeat protein [Pirellulaceae bacterium]|jgi:hypothetical protein